MLSIDSEDSIDIDGSISTHYHEAFGVFPHVEMELLKSKYDIPMKVIRFIDTRPA